MHSIYYNALLTIAACGKDAEAGLFFDRDPKNSWPCRNPTDESSFLCIENKGLRNLGEKLTLHGVIPQLGELSGRGWTLQEQFLSRRMLIFAQDGISWSCTEIACTEARPYAWAQHPGHKHFLGERGFLLKRWMNVVREYSKRSLTNWNDRLPAVAGLAQFLQDERCGRYLAGMWEAWIQNQLTWFVGSASKAQDSSGYLGPSWSWVSQPGCYIKFPWTSETTIHTLAALEIIQAECIPKCADNPFGEIKSGFLLASSALKPALVDPLSGSQISQYLEQRPSPYNYFTLLDTLAFPALLKDQESGCVVGVLALDKSPSHNAQFETQLVICTIPAWNPVTISMTGDHPKQIDCLALTRSPDSPESYIRIGFGWVTDVAWFNMRPRNAEDYNTEPEGVMPPAFKEVEGFERLKKVVRIL